MSNLEIIIQSTGDSDCLITGQKPPTKFMACGCTPAQHRLGCSWADNYYSAEKNMHWKFGENGPTDVAIVVQPGGVSKFCNRCGKDIQVQPKKHDTHMRLYHFGDKGARYLKWNDDWSKLMIVNGAAVKKAMGRLSAVMPVKWREWIVKYCEDYSTKDKHEVDKLVRGEHTQTMKVFA